MITAGEPPARVHQRVLRADFRDVDLAYDADDHDRFLAAVPAIVGAGFTPAFRYRSNDGTVTEHSFIRQDAKFEFFRLTRQDDQYRYHLYGKDPDRDDGYVELIVPFRPAARNDRVPRPRLAEAGRS